METVKRLVASSESFGSASTKSETTVKFISVTSIGSEMSDWPSVSMDSGEQWKRICATSRPTSRPELTVEVAVALSQLPRTFEDLPYAEDDDL
jgi:hypothetical protein